MKPNGDPNRPLSGSNLPSQFSENQIHHPQSIFEIPNLGPIAQTGNQIGSAAGGAVGIVFGGVFDGLNQGVVQIVGSIDKALQEVSAVIPTLPNTFTIGPVPSSQ